MESFHSARNTGITQYTHSPFLSFRGLPGFMITLCDLFHVHPSFPHVMKQVEFPISHHVDLPLRGDFLMNESLPSPESKKNCLINFYFL
jgi:hypothetical protein